MSADGAPSSRLVSDDDFELGHLSQSHYEQFRKSFVHIWMTENNLYPTMQVSEDEISAYVDILLDRARVDPRTICSCRDKSNDKIVSFTVCRDLYDDPIPRERYEALSAKVQTILKFNADVVAKFNANPLFEQYINRPKSVVYGMHIGTLREYMGLKGVEKLAARVANLAALTSAQDGFKGYLGVSTHRGTFDGAMNRLEKGQQIIFGITHWKTWSPAPGVPPPFAEIQYPPFAAGFFSLLPVISRLPK